MSNNNIYSFQKWKEFSIESPDETIFVSLQNIINNSDLDGNLKHKKESVYKVLYEYVINNISSQKITYSEGGKTIFQYPQLERQSNWPYYLYNSASLVLDLSEYRNILRSTLFLQCTFIEDLINKKKAVYYENIKLELTLRKSKKYYKALIIFIQINRLYLIDYDKQIKTFLKNMDLSLLNIKYKNYFIHEAWWLTGTTQRWYGNRIK